MPASIPGRGPVRTGPALGLVEVGSIARGVVVLDAMVKRSPVTVVDSWTASPGKYLVLVTGEVAEVDEAMEAGLAAAAEHLLDQVFLPQPDATILPAVCGARDRPTDDSVAVVETAMAAAAIRAADAAVKAAEVRLVELRLATGLGGKAYFVLAGDLFFVEAAVEAATDAAGRERLVNVELIANPHPDAAGRLA